MALTFQFPLKKIVVQLRRAGFAALVTAPALGVLCNSPEVLADGLSKKAEKNFDDAQGLDWVPLDQLTEEQKKKVPIACCGAYVPPARTDADANKAPEDAPFHAYAEETQATEKNLVKLNGKVVITQGTRSIQTENVVVDKAANRADLSGGIELRDPGVMIRADSGQMDLQTKETYMENARFVLYETRIHGVAEHLHKFGDNVINLQQSEISSCEPGDNSWQIRGSEISLHPEEHYGTAKNMRISLKDVPVFYMPYVRFPVGDERLTGFLFPTITHNIRNGWDTMVPFYWNIAPDLDATITARYMSERGPMLETEVRHLSEHFETELNGSVINNDHGGYSSYLEREIALGHMTEQQAYPYRGHNRWYAKLNQTGGKGEAWATQINYADMSDRDFLRDMYSGSVDSNRQAFITQTASADYRTDHWFMGVKTQEFRLLTQAQQPNRELPRVHADGEYQFGNWDFKLKNEYVDFVQNRYFRSGFTNEADYDNALLNTIYGQRFNSNYTATLNETTNWGFVKPTIGVRGLAYDLDTYSLADKTMKTPHFVAPQASLDVGLYFERDKVFGDNYIQTLEPRLFYFYSAYKNQDELYGLTKNGTGFVYFDTNDLTFSYDQLFRTSRFGGGDRIDDANQVSLALSSAFVSQTTGLERLRLSIGQIFYAADRRITVLDTRNGLPEENTRASSDLAGQISGQLNQRLRMNVDAAYDQRNGRLDNASGGIHYVDEHYRIFNMSYRYTLKPIVGNPALPDQITDQSLDQLDTSIYWPVSSKWSVVARNNHDFTNGVELDTFAGFEYNDCCYRVRLLGRRWLRIDYTNPKFLSMVTNHDYEPGIMLELELKGLGSMDQRISNLLDKAVPGFKEREKNLR